MLEVVKGAGSTEEVVQTTVDKEELAENSNHEGGEEPANSLKNSSQVRLSTNGNSDERKYTERRTPNDPVHLNQITIQIG